MKGLIRVALIIVGITVLTAGSVSADTLPFLDSTLYWNANGTGDDHKDTIGQPNISGGTVVTSDSGYLVSVSFNFTQWNMDKMKPGDLFLDTDINNTGWDYVMSLYNGRTAGDYYGSDSQYIPSTAFNNVPLYEVGPNSTLLWTQGTNVSGGYWDKSYYDIRNSHPYAYTNLSNSLGYGSLSGGYYNNSPLTFYLPENKVKLDGYFAIGFTQNCANDVIYESFEGEFTHAPEPSTLIFLGSGLLLLGGFFRRKRS